MGVAEGPVIVVTAAGYGHVGVPGLAGVAEDHADPVVGGQTVVEVYVVVAAEKGLVVVGDVVPDQAELILESYEVLGVHGLDGVAVGHPFLTVVGVDTDGYLASFLTALGGDDDYSVRTAGTVDGGREGILQHVHGLDFGSSDIVDVVHRETVHDVQRRGVLCDGSASADTDLDVSVRVTLSGGYRHTGHPSGQGLGYAGHGLLGYFLVADGRYGAEEVAALYCSVTDNDGLLQHRDVILHHYIDDCASVYRNDLVLHSDEDKLQAGRVDVRYFDDIRTVQVCLSSEGGAFDYDADARKGLTVRVCDHTSYLLGVECCGHAQQGRQKKA